jgi:hypothetical protein
VIAGDHERTDSGTSRFCNGCSRFGPRWVDHPDQAGEHEVVFDAFVRAIGLRDERIARQPSSGNTECPQGFPGEPVVDLKDLLSALRRQRTGLVTYELVTAASQEDVGRPFREHDPPVALLGVTM